MDLTVIRVREGKEDELCQTLSKKISSLKFMTYNRRLRERKSGEWHYVVRKMFPGYVFVKGLIDDKNYQALEKSGSIGRVLDDEVEIINQLDHREDGLIDISKVSINESQVKVIEGALKGLEDKIVSVNKRKGRAKVKVLLCGDEWLVELGVELCNPGT